MRNVNNWVVRTFNKFIFFHPLTPTRLTQQQQQQHDFSIIGFCWLRWINNLLK